MPETNKDFDRIKQKNAASQGESLLDNLTGTLRKYTD